MPFNRLNRAVFSFALSAAALISAGCSPIIYSQLAEALKSGLNNGAFSVSYNRSWATFMVGRAITPLDPVTLGGSPQTYFISPALPPGMTFDSSTGRISGAPSGTMAETTYTVTAANSTGSRSTTLALKVLPGFVVNSVLDESDATPGDGNCVSTPSGVCTLRAAVQEVIAGGSSKVVLLPNGTYGLGSEISIPASSVSIVGQSKSGTIISGQNATRMFFILMGSKVEYSDLTLRDGNNAAAAPGGGAMALNNDNNNGLRISNALFVNNQTSSGPAGGGAIALGTTLSTGVSTDIEYSEFNSNRNLVNAGAGAIAAYTGGLAIRFSQFNANDGGALSSGALGIGTPTTVDHSTFANNTGAIGGAASVAFANFITFKNSTFVGNQALQAGGAVHVYDRAATFINCTLIGNHAETGGGAVTTSASASLRAFFTNSIVASNSSTSGNANCSTAFSSQLVSNGNNISDAADCNIGTGPSDQGSVPFASIALGFLQNNGGPVQTVAIGAGSVALNAGAIGSCPSIDARGINRTGVCDVGAFEF